MAIRKSAGSGIPFGMNAGRPANPSYGQLYSNGETARLELYTQASGWQNIVQETPGVSSATGHYYQSDAQGTFSVYGTNFVDGAVAYAIGTNGIEYAATSVTYNSLVQLTVVFSNLSAAYEPYDIKVTNPSNLFGILPDAFSVNDSPAWTTAAGTILTTYAGLSISTSVAATDDELNTLSYSSSNLPAWLSLNSSTGALTGTATSSPGTYSFSISAADTYNTPVSRSFSIVVNPPTITGGVLSSDSTYYYRTFKSSSNLILSNASLPVDYLIIAGGGGGGGYGGGGGAGGYLSNSTTLSPSTYSILIGGGGAGALSHTVNGSNGENSSAFSITSSGGGFGGTASTNGNSGSSGGGGGYASNGGSGISGQGFNGGNGNSNSDPYPSGGGGGAGSVGVAASGGNVSGAGGAGKNSHSSWLSAITTQMSDISNWSTATSTGYIAGGGGGGVAGGNGYTTNGVPGSGGIGGGGSGGKGGVGKSAGTTNTGGGGGGAGYNGSSQEAIAMPGGSGIVIIRYTKASVGG
jgi:hypothetical protein